MLTSITKNEKIATILIIFGTVFAVFGSYSEYWWTPVVGCCRASDSSLVAGYFPEAIGFCLIAFGTYRGVGTKRATGPLSLVAGAFVLIYGLWLYFIVTGIEETGNGALFLPNLALRSSFPFLISGPILLALSIFLWIRKA